MANTAIPASVLGGSGGGSGSAPIEAVAGEPISDRALVYLDLYNECGNGPDRWYKVDTDAVSPVKISPVLGIALASQVTPGFTFNCQAGPGLVTGFTGLSEGEAVYADVVAGTLTQMKPDVPAFDEQIAVRRIGQAISGTAILFNPEPKTRFLALARLNTEDEVAVSHYTDDNAPSRSVTAFVYRPSYTNEVPVMTSNTSPSGYVVTSSSVLSSLPNSQYHAFDHNTTAASGGGWVSDTNGNNGANEWLEMQFPSPVLIQRAAIWPTVTSFSGRNPKDFKIQGYNDSTWDSLLTVTGETSWAQNVRKAYDWITSSSCTRVRLYVDAINNTANLIAEIMELELFSVSTLVLEPVTIASRSYNDADCVTVENTDATTTTFQNLYPATLDSDTHDIVAVVEI